MTNEKRERPEEHKRREAEDEIPPSPVLRRRGSHPGAGADTPAGPSPDSTSEPMKRARRLEEEKDREELEQGARD